MRNPVRNNKRNPAWLWIVTGMGLVAAPALPVQPDRQDTPHWRHHGKRSAMIERERINSVMRSALRQPETNEKRLVAGVEAMAVTAEPFDKRARTELVNWERLVKPSGITVE